MVTLERTHTTAISRAPPAEAKRHRGVEGRTMLPTSSPGTVMMEPTDPAHYWAFISYSHIDRAWAEWLQRALERYVLPKTLVGKHSTLGPIPRRLFPVFRDEDELSSAPSLGSKIESALRGSRTLIVVCSPAARASVWVDREIEYFANLGRATRIFALLVQGSPHDVFPVQLVAACGDPLAADVRSGTRVAKRDALLRIVAGIFELSFDDLVHRDEARRRRARLVAAAGTVAASLAATFGYVGLADARLNVPGAPAIRETLDARDLSVFRHVPSDRDIRASMIATDASLLRILDDGAKRTDYEYGSLNAPRMTRDQWSAAQAAAATFAGGFETAAETADQTMTLERSFAPGAYASRAGRPYGWLDYSFEFKGYLPTTSSESVCWTILALSEALHSGRFDAATRARLLHDRDIASEMLRRYGQNADGSWNQRPDQTEVNASTYTSVLMYQALLASREAGLPWNGSISGRERALARVRAFLLASFGRGSANGWLPDAGWGEVKSHFEGLDMQIVTSLYRDERDGGARVPDAVVRFADRMMPAFEVRPYDPSAANSLMSDPFIDINGVHTAQQHAVTFLWYPWALALSAERYARDRRTPGTPHVRLVESRRILANLAVTDGAQLLTNEDTVSAWWIASECAYGLGQALEAGYTRVAPATT
jgi:hypothetical protein